MISLARHIELLLLTHDCVIVPGLGGFIASRTEACYSSSDEMLFFPPFRTIGFNQQLQVNDGLLVQSYMSAYEAAYPAAMLQMEKEVDQFVNILNTSHEATLENVGTLKKSLNGNITFTPLETGVLTPSLYGLSSYSIKSLDALKKDRELANALNISTTMAVATKQDKNEPVAENENKNPRIVTLRRWIDISSSVAAAALLFFCLSYTAMKSNNQENDTCIASVCPSETPAAIKNTANNTGKTASQPTKTNVKPDAPAKIDAAKTPPQTSAIPAETKANNNDSKHSTTTGKGAYSIVLASYVSKANAEILISRLTKNGYDKASYEKTGKVSRILYSKYNSESDAQQELSALRKESSEFKDAWVLELK